MVVSSMANLFSPEFYSFTTPDRFVLNLELYNSPEGGPGHVILSPDIYFCSISQLMQSLHLTSPRDADMSTGSSTLSLSPGQTLNRKTVQLSDL